MCVIVCVHCCVCFVLIALSFACHAVVSPCRFLKATAELGVAVLDAVSWHQYVHKPYRIVGIGQLYEGAPINNWVNYR